MMQENTYLNRSNRIEKFFIIFFIRVIVLSRYDKLKRKEEIAAFVQSIFSPEYISFKIICEIYETFFFFHCFNIYTYVLVRLRRMYNTYVNIETI